MEGHTPNEASNGAPTGEQGEERRLQRIRKPLRSEGHWEREPSLETTVPTYSSGDVAMDLKLGQCQALLSRLKRHKHAWPFNQPVDPVALDLPDYWEVVKRPMDLGTIGDKLTSGQYAKVSEFLDDLELVWSNCLLYNPPDDPISEWATLLRKTTHRLAKQLGVIEHEGLATKAEGSGERKERSTPVRRGREGAETRRNEEDEDLEDASYMDTSAGRRRSSARLSAKSGKRYYGEEEGEEEEEEEEDLEGGSRKASRRTTNGDGHQQQHGNDDGGSSEPEGAAGPIVDKILAHRVTQERAVKKGGGSSSSVEEAEQEEKGETDAAAAQEQQQQQEEEGAKTDQVAAEPVTEYYVKWKEKSYLHCEWVTADVIEREGTVGRGKINRYHKKKQEMALDALALPRGAGGMEEEEEEPPFPPAYCEIDRIIAYEELIEPIPPQDMPPVSAAVKAETAGEGAAPSPQHAPASHLAAASAAAAAGPATHPSAVVPLAHPSAHLLTAQHAPALPSTSTPAPSVTVGPRPAHLPGIAPSSVAPSQAAHPYYPQQTGAGLPPPFVPPQQQPQQARVSAPPYSPYSSAQHYPANQPHSAGLGGHSPLAPSAYPHQQYTGQSSSRSQMPYPHQGYPPAALQPPVVAVPAPPQLPPTHNAQLWHQLQAWRGEMVQRSTAPPAHPALTLPGTSAATAVPTQPAASHRVKPEKLTPGPGERVVRRYLVKWCDLPYTDCTWESAADLKDDEKIAQFHKWNTPPAHTNTSGRPISQWAPLNDPTFKNDNKLRKYQLEGLNWLVYCWYNRRGSILADEMGLGKTVQSITFLEYLHRNQYIHGPFLIVCPLSTLPHWIRELEGWTEMNGIIYQGNAANRTVIREYEWYYQGQGQKRAPGQFKFNVLLTTYEMILRTDWAELSKINWKALIIDEAHRLKNKRSKLLERLKLFKTDHRIILTGTPLQNNTEELWTLLNFIEPHIFTSLPSFLQNFGDLKDAEQVGHLHTVLRPHLLRRLKEDVESSIPPKEEVLVEVELTSLQKKYYRAILERNREFLNKGCSGGNVPNLINVVMQLRKVCNHPFLIQGVEEKETAKLEAAAYYNLFIQSAGKLALLDKLLPKLKARGSKVLIFSQMVRVLDLLESYLRFRGHLYERLDGNVRGNDRQASIDRFSKPGSNRFVFLLCTRAGGVGINLASADTVVIYDSDWNPQNDLQAQARCHRIGQTKEVKVYRLITSKTYERQMFERTSKKLGLDQAVLDNINITDIANTKTKKETLAQVGKEINDLLKYGAYDLFREDEEGKGGNDIFGEDDIDKILERASTVVRYERAEENNTSGDAEGAAGAKDKKGSTFSKAFFSSSHADTDIDINAENFWELVLPEAKNAGRLLERLREGKVGDTEAKVDEFWEDLTGVVQESLEQWKKTISPPRDLHFLNAIMDEILEGRAGVSFTDEQLDQAALWAAQLNRPRKRRGRGAEDEWEMPSLSRTDEAYGSDDTGGRGVKRRLSGAAAMSDEGRRRSARNAGKQADDPKRRKLGEIPDFNMSERKRIQEAVLAFARPHWTAIKAKTKLHKRPLGDIRSYALAFLRVCADAAKGEDHDIFQELILFMQTQGPKYGEENPPDVAPKASPASTASLDESPATRSRRMGAGRSSAGSGSKPTASFPSLVDPAYLANVRRKIKGWAKRLVILNRLRTEVEKFDAPDQFRLPATFTEKKNQRPVPWWGREEDRDLLVGSYVHGLGSFEALFADEALCFYRHHRSLANLADGGGEETATTMASSRASRVGKTSNKGGRAKGKEPARDHDEYEEEEEEFALAIEEEEEDEDDEPHDGDHEEEEEEGGSDGKTPSSKWPAKRVLNLRVKALLDTIDKVLRIEARERQRQEKIKSKEDRKRMREDEREQRLQQRHQRQAVKRQRLEERRGLWSKRERGDFRVALMAYGPGRWEFIIDKARLVNKDDEACEDYYDELMAYVRKMCEEYPNPYVGLAKAGKRSTRSASRSLLQQHEDLEGHVAPTHVGGEERSDDGGEDEDDEPAESEADDDEADDFEASTTSSSSSSSVTSLENPYLLSPIIAHRLLDRVSLWEELRHKLLSRADLRQRMGAVTRGKMPQWWYPGEHDVALLHAVDECGIGNSGRTWDELLNDPGCVFYTKTPKNGRPVPRKQRELFLREFVEDKSPLLNRLRYYCHVVLEPDATAESRPRRKRTRPEEEGEAEEESEEGALEEDVAHIGTPSRKRSKLGSASARPIPVRPVARDEAGNPVLPITVKGTTILDLGEIVWDRPLFHSKQYLWPTGFKSTKRLPSISNPEEYTTYTSEIVDTGDDAPTFRVTPEDRPDLVFEHSTSSGVWTQALKAIKKKPSVSVSGPEMFGYASPVIQLLFQELPDAEKCEKYLPKAFEETPDSPASPSASPKRLGDAEADNSRTLRAEKRKQLEVEKLKAEVRQLQEQLQARKQAVARKALSNFERRAGEEETTIVEEQQEEEEHEEEHEGDELASEAEDEEADQEYLAED